MQHPPQTINTPIEITRQLYQSFFRGDIAAILETMDEDVDWIWYGPHIIPWAGHHQGRDAVRTFFDKVATFAEPLVYEPREFIAGENGVVTVLGWQRVRAKPTGHLWETAWTHIFTIHGGKFVRVREFYDSAAVAAAFSSND